MATNNAGPTTSNSTNPATTPDQQLQRCFYEWMSQQQDDLTQLTQAMGDPHPPHPDLAHLVRTIVAHFQGYADRRAHLANHGANAAPSLLSPIWCSPFENSCLWLAGCRPSLFVRLVYSLSSSDVEAQLPDFFRGVRHGNLRELSARQLFLLNELHCKAIREEERLSGRMASMQEGMADWPRVEAGGRVEVGKAVEESGGALGGVVEEADKLRMEIFRELVLGILTPLQAAELLVAGKRLHLSLHEWCKRGGGQRILHACHVKDLDYGLVGWSHFVHG